MSTRPFRIWRKDVKPRYWRLSMETMLKESLEDLWEIERNKQRRDGGEKNKAYWRNSVKVRLYLVSIFLHFFLSFPSFSCFMLNVNFKHLMEKLYVTYYCKTFTVWQLLSGLIVNVVLTWNVNSCSNIQLYFNKKHRICSLVIIYYSVWSPLKKTTIKFQINTSVLFGLHKKYYHKISNKYPHLIPSI